MKNLNRNNQETKKILLFLLEVVARRLDSHNLKVYFIMKKIARFCKNVCLQSNPLKGLWHDVYSLSKKCQRFVNGSLVVQSRYTALAILISFNGGQGAICAIMSQTIFGPIQIIVTKRNRKDTPRNRNSSATL